MKLSKSFGLAFSNIMYDKMRSILTMLGIIVGVAAVIILVSLMNGMTGMITDSFEDMGTTSITVSVTERGGSRTVYEEDIYRIRDDNPDLISGVSPSVTARGTIKVPGSTDSIMSTATGVSEEYADMKMLNVEQGRFLTFMDMETLSHNCVIFTYIQQQLFGGMQAVGQTIKINGVSYNVIGVLEEKAESKQRSADDCIYIPYTTALRASTTSYISSYTLTAVSEDMVESACDMLERELFKITGDEDYFTVSNMLEIIETMTEMLDTMTILLVCIAGISLLVGGIGIMNIMLVSVTERTREIGIRKSLGAKRSAIMSQFVIEAGVVSGIGGIIGIVLGSVVAIFAGNLLSLTATPSVGAIVTAFSVSVGIGIIFGYLPAKNAATLNPIDALRHE